MFGKMAKMTANFVKNSNGTINGMPRIRNVTRNTNIIGYAAVNVMATTAYARTKVHKGWFFCPETDIINGDLIEDRVDHAYYLVMSVKNMFNGNETVYLDGTLFFCDTTVTVQRFNAEGARDTFGRPIVSAPQTMVTGVKCMSNPQNYDVLQQEDRLVAQNKIKFCVQDSAGVLQGDRILSEDHGTKYQVISVDPISLTNLSLLTVDTDVR